MNIQATKTRSEQRIEQLINAGRPLTDEESEELYRALHADYMCKWRAARAKAERRRYDLMASEPDQARMRLLESMRAEAAR
jgi:hypothetical protein